jgi:tetratricopeptide (TPR) repeat protein
MAESGELFSPGENRRFGNRFYVAIVVLLFAAFVFQLYFHAVRTSATIDEPPHILAGHRHLQCGDFGINPEHPPLAKMLAAAPLQFRALNEPDWECGSRLTPKPEMFSAGTSFVVRNGIDAVVVPARLFASLSAMFLAVLVFLAAWEMFGRREALTALAIVAFEPSLIGIGSLVLTDMILTATAFAAVFALYRWRRNATWARFLIVGSAFGMMLAAKHSAVVFAPILFALLVADVLVFRSNETGLPRRILRQTANFAAFFLIGWAILWAFYGFRYSSIPNPTGDTISVAEYIRENGRPEMVGTFSARATDAVNRLHLFPESYVLGMADVVAWGSRNSFLFGVNYPTGQWFYFPVAFAVKSSVALLLLLPLGLLLPFFNAEKRREMLFLLLPPLAFFGIALTSSMTIGIRHLLPVYGFFIVAASAGALWLARKFSFFKYVLIALLVYHAATAVRIAPHYAVFANDFWGGYEKTHRIFHDSNVDIGQNLKLAGDYLKRENVNDCWFAAFNHRELVEAMLPQCRVLPSALRILVSQTVIEPVPPVVEGTILISFNELPPRGGGEYLPIAKSEPIAFLGGNTFVYRGRFEVPLAAAMSHAYRSGQFLRVNQINEAVAEAREAVRLAPEDPRPHLALGLALSRAGQRDEARRELETAAESAKTNPAFRNAEVRARQELERLK